MWETVTDFVMYYPLTSLAIVYSIIAILLAHRTIKRAESGR